jgi:aspartate racemase
MHDFKNMKAKKKLGIIGGMGARASSLFLQKIIDYSPAMTDQEFIEIILHNNALIPDRTRAIVYKEESPVTELLRSVNLFNENNVEVIALACITSYHYYHELAKFSKAEIIEPVQLIRKHISKYYNYVRRVGLLATTGTIKSQLFSEEFKSHGLEIVTLNEEDQERYFMQSVYMENGLKSSRISSKAIELLLTAVSKLEEKGAEIIIGGCSEVQIALQQNNVSLPFIDSIDLLAQESVKQCYDINE